MPNLEGIRGREVTVRKVKRTGVEPMVLQALQHDAELDDPFRHFDSSFPKLLSQNRRQLFENLAARRSNQFKLEFHPISVANTVTIMIFPSGSIEELCSPLGIVRQRFDVGIEIFCAGIEE